MLMMIDGRAAVLIRADCFDSLQDLMEIPSSVVATL